MDIPRELFTDDSISFEAAGFLAKYIALHGVGETEFQGFRETINTWNISRQSIKNYLAVLQSAGWILYVKPDRVGDTATLKIYDHAASREEQKQDFYNIKNATKNYVSAGRNDYQNRSTETTGQTHVSAGRNDYQNRSTETTGQTHVSAGRRSDDIYNNIINIYNKIYKNKNINNNITLSTDENLLIDRVFDNVTEEDKKFYQMACEIQFRNGKNFYKGEEAKAKVAFLECLRQGYDSLTIYEAYKTYEQRFNASKVDGGDKFFTRLNVFCSRYESAQEKGIAQIAGISPAIKAEQKAFRMQAEAKRRAVEKTPELALSQGEIAYRHMANECLKAYCTANPKVKVPSALPKAGYGLREIRAAQDEFNEKFEPFAEAWIKSDPARLSLYQTHADMVSCRHYLPQKLVMKLGAVVRRGISVEELPQAAERTSHITQSINAGNQTQTQEQVR